MAPRDGGNVGAFTCHWRWVCRRGNLRPRRVAVERGEWRYKWWQT
uniref:Uncharacterized protein n=1 Tax=Arundo donax TaxID=35708 RepID=A0A0A9EM04_ARUDO